MNGKITTWLVGAFQYNRRGVIGKQNVQPSLLSNKVKLHLRHSKSQSCFFSSLLVSREPKWLHQAEWLWLSWKVEQALI